MSTRGKSSHPPLRRPVVPLPLQWMWMLLSPCLLLLLPPPPLLLFCREAFPRVRFTNFSIFCSTRDLYLLRQGPFEGNDHPP